MCHFIKADEFRAIYIVSALLSQSPMGHKEIFPLCVGLPRADLLECDKVIVLLGHCFISVLGDLMCFSSGILSDGIDFNTRNRHLVVLCIFHEISSTINFL